MRYWKKVNPDNTTKSVESYSHDLPVAGAIEIDKTEFEDYIASLPPPPTPVDWKARFAAASTATDKLNIIAERLGLK